MILCIETATSVCSVSLCHKGELLEIRESSEEKSHASLLTVFIEDILKKTGLQASELDAVAVSKGPGSYTGLRIGVSAAKGIAYAAELPLIAIPTTAIMYYGARTDKEYDYFCPMIDARRMEVYTAVYDNKGSTVIPISAHILTDNSFSEILEKGKVLFFGDGAEKCRDIIKHPSAFFNGSFRTSSTYMCKPAQEAFDKGDFEDTAYFEPFYLKDFIATIPKKNIYGRSK
ncbi:MAG: tRNA (adenosine(37)-N6)-threonylcarbamoyltransferase complex dimerization subunit type 1 TsaB [Bacteroidales bacterium]|nr:tRNA (adenosine(37)-N6)-threonylcarbamoyltransferase complex dimerization subunit type 1 TsaB [Bacteroidales bacterium]